MMIPGIVASRRRGVDEAGFPVVISNSGWSQTVSASTQHVIPLPTVDSGDAVLLHFVDRGQAVSGEIYTPAGWVQVSQRENSGKTRSTWLWRVTDGTEGATVTIESAVATAYCSAQLYRIAAGTFRSGALPEIATGVGAASSAPNHFAECPAIAPSWGFANTVFIASAGFKSNMSISSGSDYPYPLGQLFTQGSQGGWGGSGQSAYMLTCYAELAAAGVTASRFFVTGARNYVSATIAIRPR